MAVGFKYFYRVLGGAEQREGGVLESQFGPASRPELPFPTHSGFLVHVSTLLYCYDTQSALWVLQLKPP